MMAPGNPNNLWSINEYNYYGLMMMPRSSPSISQQPLLLSSSSSSSSSQPTADDLILPNPLHTQHGIHSSCGLLGDVDDGHDDGSRGQHRHQHDDGQKRHEDPSQLNLWRPAAREFPAVPFPDVNVSATEQQRSSPYSFVHDPDNNHHGHTAHHQHHQYCVTPSSNILSFSSNIAAADAAAYECKNTAASDSTCKKARVFSFSSAAQPPLKARKEKLGGRITALHQLVSPFGKTDTASVLLEATGYIRFLEGQIKSLSAPYLGYNESTQLPAEEVGSPKDLRSRGLCLVPVACTHLVGSHDEMNGPDLWGSAPSSGGL